tara:strand:- start:579 stop:695 length:117 start_codon:yes stop_codon:yes gene_type:complete
VFLFFVTNSFKISDLTKNKKQALNIFEKRLKMEKTKGW